MVRLNLGMMRGGKEGENMASPMFPRLHVNDTDKGGPRAPPRNKMALYEQLSIPSQRFNSSSLPLPPQTARNVVAPSSGQGNGNEGTLFSSFYASASAPYSGEKVKSRSSDRENVRTAKMEFERRSTRCANAVGSGAECSSLKHDSLNTKGPCRKIVDEDDDFRVPTFVNSENSLYVNKDTTGIDKRRLALVQANSARNGYRDAFNDFVQLASSCDRHAEQNSTSDAKAGQHEKRCNEQMSNNADQAEVSLSHPEAGEKPPEPKRLAKSSSDGERMGSRGTCHESCGNSAVDRPRAHIESHAKASLSRRPENVDGIRISEDKENRSLEPKDVDKNAEMSDMSMMDCITGLDISPDDVVGMIGPKQFWKARRAIVNQQRVFALQVFELHRLIKVQKLLAASPHLLLEENSCGNSQKVATKNLPLESYDKPRLQTIKQRDDTQKLHQKADHQTESIEGSPHPAPNDVINRALDQTPGSGGPHSVNASPVHPHSDNRSNPWCFQPPTPQWLVPVMSPSEGLIYKPYAGPCPPPAGFMAPVYGNYNPMSLPPGYAIPAHQQQNSGVLSGASPMAPSYMPTPYGLPAINPMISPSPVDQMSPMAGPRPNIHTEQNSRSSCNMSFPKSDALTGRPWKVHASKDSELQGSTASSPCDKSQEGRDALPLFPMATVVEASAQPSESNEKEHERRVIRVVPHNAKSATESAARIFRSIQEERQQLEQ